MSHVNYDAKDVVKPMQKNVRWNLYGPYVFVTCVFLGQLQATM